MDFRRTAVPVKKSAKKGPNSMSRAMVAAHARRRQSPRDRRRENIITFLKVTVHRSRRDSLSRVTPQPAQNRGFTATTALAVDVSTVKSYSLHKVENSITLQRHLVARHTALEADACWRISHGTKGGSLAPLALNDS
ncbi:hypothetical protein HN011_007223 [Eciton burchellii]|nr:hypothetical protein HN011_007223 [Eciton burchellii]